MSRNDDSFYVVWCPSGGPPTVKHPSLASAEAEAKRLARAHTGHEFFVLMAISMTTKQDVAVTRYRSSVHDNDIPF
jgi:hypothetical protein